MTFTRIVNAGFFLSMVLFLLPGYVCAMKTHHGRVADPETGAAVKDAQVFVMLAGTMKSWPKCFALPNALAANRSSTIALRANCCGQCGRVYLSPDMEITSY